MTANTRRHAGGGGDFRLSDQAGDEYRATRSFEPLLTMKAAANAVGVCQETNRRAYLARQLKIERIGTRSIRVRPSELQAWMERGGQTTAV